MDDHQCAFQIRSLNKTASQVTKEVNSLVPRPLLAVFWVGFSPPKTQEKVGWHQTRKVAEG